MNSAEELQRLLYATLSGDAAIMAVAGGVYDHVPALPYKAKTAYISFGPSDASEDEAECINGVRITQQIDIWSNAQGVVECKALTDLVRRKLHQASLTLSDNALAGLYVEIWRVIPNPGGEHHGVVQITAMVEEN